MNQLPSLIAEWLTAKEAERAANARRVEAERQMALLLPIEGVEGSARAEADGYAVRVAYKVTRSVDTFALQARWGDLDSRAQKAFGWKAEIKTKEFRALQEMAPDVFATIAPLVETKPAKPSVTVEAVEREAA